MRGRRKTVEEDDLPSQEPGMGNTFEEYKP